MKELNTIPSIVTLIRFLLIPVIIYLVAKDQIMLALVIFIIAVASDKIDGYLARKLKQETYYGGMFDAFTDTVMIFSVAIMLAVKEYMPLVILLILLAPKILTFILLATVNKREYKPTIFSRLTSGMLYIIVMLILLKSAVFLILPLIFALYILSAIHWIKLVKIR